MTLQEAIKETENCLEYLKGIKYGVRPEAIEAKEILLSLAYKELEKRKK